MWFLRASAWRVLPGWSLRLTPIVHQTSSSYIVNRVQIILSLLTIGASGVVSGVVTFRLNAARDARRMRREKLERLFLSHTGFLRQLDVNWFPYLAVMAGDIEYNDALDMTKKHVGEERHFESVEMLVSLYFPELSGGLRELVAIRDDAAKLIGEHKREYKRIGPHRSPALQEMIALADRLEAHQRSFRAKMAKVAGELGAQGAYAA